VIILKIPRKTGEKSNREFILRYVKKLRRNQKRKHIQLQGEVAYSQNNVYFIFPSRGLELAFALSILIKCKQNEIPCTLELSKPVNPEELPSDIKRCSEIWAERKLLRKCYKLRKIEL